MKKWIRFVAVLLSVLTLCGPFSALTAYAADEPAEEISEIFETATREEPTHTDPRED